MYALAKEILRHAGENRDRQLAVLTLLTIFNGLVEVMALGLLAAFISSLTAPEKVIDSQAVQTLSTFFSINFTQDRLTFYSLIGGAALAMILFKNMLIALHTWLTARYDGALNLAYGEKMLAGIDRIPYETFVRLNFSDIYSTISWRVFIGNMLTNAMAIFSDLTVSLIIFFSLFYLNPKTTLLVFLVISLMGLSCFLLLRKRSLRLGQRATQSLLDVNRVQMKTVQGFRDLKIFDNIDESLYLFHRDQTSYVHYIAKQRVLTRIPVFLLESLAFGGLIVGTIVMLRHDGRSSEEVMVMLSLIAVSAWRVLPAIYRSVSAMVAIRTDYPRVERVLAFVRFIDSHTQKDPEAHETAMPVLQSTIAIDGLRFRYSDKDSEALKGVDVTIHKGQMVGFIGHSGSGKSTMADLITGLLFPSAGGIFVDDVKLEQRNARSWRKQIGIVPQKPFLFDGTIAENIGFSMLKERIDMERVKLCCDLAGASDFIERLPGGVHYTLGNNAGNLSGGQAQRLAIARALYRDPSVLIFDEATSSLDDKTERIIRDTITGIRGSRTIIIIAHRMTAVEHCDIIYWFDDGDIIQNGSPEEIIPKYTFISNS
ncbi:ABC transporter ATP-binding protein [Paucidesulfovibrio longus]|uniref:ABC transporter ATP-binding protein n=1 Tax=Paucidesulfovibrio longus TaxID=889 RepID=UPI0003B6195D|nr:ATP-binding cassette domain-containing protein [Paucidesulfovibrio longus]